MEIKDKCKQPIDYLINESNLIKWCVMIGRLVKGSEEGERSVK